MGLAAGEAPSQHWGPSGERRLFHQLVGRGAPVLRVPGPFTPMHPAALGLQVAAPEPDLAQRLAELKNSK